jgi:hypothetical protein
MGVSRSQGTKTRYNVRGCPPVLAVTTDQQLHFIHNLNVLSVHVQREDVLWSNLVEPPPLAKSNLPAHQCITATHADHRNLACATPTERDCSQDLSPSPKHRDPNAFMHLSQCMTISKNYDNVWIRVQTHRLPKTKTVPPLNLPTLAGLGRRYSCTCRRPQNSSR